MSGARCSFLLGCFALSSLLSAVVFAGSVPRQDTSWKRYRNTGAGYCVSYPTRWYRGDAFDGSGLYVMTGAKKHSRATGEIDVGIFPNAVSNQAHTANISLTEDFKSHVDGMMKFERAERLEVLDQHPTEVAGSPALFTKDRYYDPQDRSTWMEEVLFVRHKNDLYRLELECKADQLLRFEAVFTQLVNSFTFDCVNEH